MSSEVNSVNNLSWDIRSGTSARAIIKSIIEVSSSLFNIIFEESLMRSSQNSLISSIICIFNSDYSINSFSKGEQARVIISLNLRTDF